jgi:hypothetical protein
MDNGILYRPVHIHIYVLRTVDRSGGRGSHPDFSVSCLILLVIFNEEGLLSKVVVVVVVVVGFYVRKQL